MSMSKATSLAKIVMPPSKLASFLNWNNNTGVLLALHLHGNSVGLAVAQRTEHAVVPVGAVDCTDMFHGRAAEYLHRTAPSAGERGDDPRRAMRARRGALEGEFARRIAHVVETHEIAAIVANWPVAPDGARRPKECGKVLRVLDIMNTHAPGVLSTTRPVALWEEQHNTVDTATGMQSSQKLPSDILMDFMDTFSDRPSEECSSEDFLFVSDTTQNRSSYA
mmetsp:Transcript_44076/g.86425  ORF Transcript_44076/g.86425 Transcript_44076/m.86425 type:complete len:222 (-) Transcript_44076:157-822(-)